MMIRTNFLVEQSMQKTSLHLPRLMMTMILILDIAEKYNLPFPAVSPILWMPVMPVMVLNVIMMAAVPLPLRITRPQLSNFTFVGPNNATGTASNHNYANRWRRRAQFVLRNSILVGYQKGGFAVESKGAHGMIISLRCF